MLLLQVARKDLLRWLRDRKALVISLVLPLVITFIMGLSFGGGVFGKQGISAIEVVGVGEDLPAMLRDRITEGLEESGFFSVTWADSAGADRMVRSGEAAAAVVLPDDLLRRFLRYEAITIGVWKDPASQLKAGIVEQVIERGLRQVQAGEAVYTGLWPADMEDRRDDGWSETLEDYFEGDFQSVWKRWRSAGQDPFWDVFRDRMTTVMDRQVAMSDALAGPGIELQVEDKAPVSRESEPEDVNLFNYFLPTFSVFFLMFGIAAATRDFHREREMGTLQRQSLSPLRASDFVLGKWLSATLQGCFQLLALYLAGAILFQVNLGPDPWSLALVVLLTCTAASGFFLLLTLVCRTEKIADNLTTIVVLSAAMVGGNMVPIDSLPAWVHVYSRVFFNYWANLSFSRVIVSNEHAWSRPLPLLVLAGLSAILLAGCLAAYAVRRRRGGLLR